MNDQRRDACHLQRKDDEKNTDEILAEGEGVPSGVEHVRIERRAAVRKGEMVPVENPGIEIRIGRPGHGTLEVRRQRPRHENREDGEETEQRPARAQGQMRRERSLPAAEKPRAHPASMALACKKPTLVENSLIANAVRDLRWYSVVH